jgi:hypothetical protein
VRWLTYFRLSGASQFVILQVLRHSCQELVFVVESLQVLLGNIWGSHSRARKQVNKAQCKQKKSASLADARNERVVGEVLSVVEASERVSS